MWCQWRPRYWHWLPAGTGSPYWCLVVEAAAETEKEGAGGVGVGGRVVGPVVGLAVVICITTSS